MAGDGDLVWKSWSVLPTSDDDVVKVRNEAWERQAGQAGVLACHCSGRCNHLPVTSHTYYSTGPWSIQIEDELFGRWPDFLTLDQATLHYADTVLLFWVRKIERKHSSSVWCVEVHLGCCSHYSECFALIPTTFHYRLAFKIMYSVKKLIFHHFFIFRQKTKQTEEVKVRS